jgi:hypothetical protein
MRYEIDDPAAFERMTLEFNGLLALIGLTLAYLAYRNSTTFVGFLGLRMVYGLAFVAIVVLLLWITIGLRFRLG